MFQFKHVWLLEFFGLKIKTILLCVCGYCVIATNKRNDSIFKKKFTDRLTVLTDEPSYKGKISAGRLKNTLWMLKSNKTCIKNGCLLLDSKHWGIQGLVVTDQVWGQNWHQLSHKTILSEWLPVYSLTNLSRHQAFHSSPRPFPTSQQESSHMEPHKCTCYFLQTKIETSDLPLP